MNIAEPRKSVAAIILSDCEPAEILLVKRSPGLRFMPNHYVFPGGSIDKDDGGGRVLHAESDEHARSILAVAREIFEETGLLCCVEGVPSIDELYAYREKMDAGVARFSDVIERYGVTLDADRFVPAGRWITPMMAPIRFDTQYYIYFHQGPRYERLHEAEIVALDWLTAAEARRRWRDNKLKLSPPVAYALKQLASFPYPNCIEHLRTATERVPGIPGQIELRQGVRIFPLVTETIPPATHTNCLVFGEEELLIVDPGPTDVDELAWLQSQIDRILLTGASVKAVLLSHAHPDHVGGAVALRARYGAPIWAHEAAARRLDFGVDRHVQDGETIVLRGDRDWELTCIHTPGHDSGHLCLLETTTRTLFAGDMVANPGTIVVAHEFGGDMDQYLKSLERLIACDFSLLIPSHGIPPKNPKEKLRETIAHRLWRERRIKDAWDAGHTTMDALLSAAYDDAPKESLGLAALSLKAHLHRLGLSAS